MGKEINWENLMEFSAEERQDFIVDEATEIRDDLKNNKENPIVTSSPKSKSSSKYPQPIPPYIGSGEIKLIIIGQDPTVGSIATRKKINTTLMLDDKNAELTKYIEKQICKPLGLSLANVYATNLFKYFYAHRPTSKNVDILKSHLEPNLKLLKDELKQYPNVPIITLGRPVLRLLTNDDENELKTYWDHPKGNPSNFKKVEKEDNLLGRTFYPVIHITSQRKKFYKDHLREYIDFIDSDIKK